jgi:hypothetical protein
MWSGGENVLPVYMLALDIFRRVCVDPLRNELAQSMLQLDENCFDDVVLFTAAHRVLGVDSQALANKWARIDQRYPRIATSTLAHLVSLPIVQKLDSQHAQLVGSSENSSLWNAFCSVDHSVQGLLHRLDSTALTIVRDSLDGWQQGSYAIAFNVCLALLPLHLPPYVLLEFIDWLPGNMLCVRQYRKMALIEKMQHTYKRIIDARALPQSQPQKQLKV